LNFWSLASVHVFSVLRRSEKVLGLYLFISAGVTSAMVLSGIPPTKGIPSGSNFPTLGTGALEGIEGVEGVLGGGCGGPLLGGGGGDLCMMDAGRRLNEVPTI
jgi:hypothetical protein